MGYFTTFKDKGGKSRFNLVAGNHQVILSSQGYSTPKSRNNGIKSVQKHCKAMKNFEKKTSKKGQPFFVLKASNGEILGKSEMYSGHSGCNNGIKSVQKNGTSKTIKEA